MRSLVLVRHNVALLLREPGPMLSRIGMPLVLMTALQPLYRAALGPDGLPQAVAGMLVLFSMLGLSIVGTSVLAERTWHTLDRLRATPVRASDVLIGKALPQAGVLLAQQSVVLGFAHFVLGLTVPRPDLLLATGMAWALTLLCGGAAIATVVRSHSGLSAITDIGGLFLTVLGGAMVPIALMPAWLRPFAPASPGYWALSGLRAALAGNAPAALTSAAILVIVAAILGAVATRRIARGWGRTT